MGESTKAFSAIVMIVASVATIFVWTADRPDLTTWVFRIVCPALVLFALVLILKLQFRKDHAHDYLRQQVGNYFNRDGFCFGFASNSLDGIAIMEAYFQNQHDKPCLGRIVLRPARGFLMGRATFETVTFDIECGPAAFGVARIAIPIPEKLQGKRQSFEVGASVDYPQGKGERLRFYDGTFIRSNTNFVNAFGTALTVAGAAGGAIVLATPATVAIKLPSEVNEAFSDASTPEFKTYWKLGDPPLEDRHMETLP